MEITARILMCLNVLFFALCCFAKNKVSFLFFNILSTIFFILQYVCQSAWTGVIVVTVDLLRIIAFYFYEKYSLSKKIKIITCVVAYLVSLILSIIWWNAWYDVFPLIGLACVYVTICFSRLSIVKFGNVLTATCSVIYLIYLDNVFNAILEGVILIAAVVAIILQIKNEIKQKHQTKQI